MIVILGMITNVLNHFDVDFFMPIKMVDENMERAHMRDAINRLKFHWKVSNIKRSDFENSKLTESDYLISGTVVGTTEDKFEELYIHEILEGKPEVGYAGIVPLIRHFMELKKFDLSHVAKIEEYLKFLIDRSKGTLMTGAAYLRNIVL